MEKYIGTLKSDLEKPSQQLEREVVQIITNIKI